MNAATRDPVDHAVLPIDPMAELLAAADSWERRRSPKMPRSVTTDAEARLVAAVVAMRRGPVAADAGPCTRCGESAEASARGSCKGPRKATP